MSSQHQRSLFHIATTMVALGTLGLVSFGALRSANAGLLNEFDITTDTERKEVKVILHTDQRVNYNTDKSGSKFTINLKDTQMGGDLKDQGMPVKIDNVNKFIGRAVPVKGGDTKIIIPNLPVEEYSISVLQKPSNKPAHLIGTTVVNAKPPAIIQAKAQPELPPAMQTPPITQPQPVAYTASVPSNITPQQAKAIEHHRNAVTSSQKKATAVASIKPSVKRRTKKAPTTATKPKPKKTYTVIASNNQKSVTTPKPSLISRGFHTVSTMLSPQPKKIAMKQTKPTPKAIKKRPSVVSKPTVMVAALPQKTTPSTAPMTMLNVADEKPTTAVAMPQTYTVVQAVTPVKPTITDISDVTIRTQSSPPSIISNQPAQSSQFQTSRSMPTIVSTSNASGRHYMAINPRTPIQTRRIISRSSAHSGRLPIVIRGDQITDPNKPEMDDTSDLLNDSLSESIAETGQPAYNSHSTKRYQRRSTARGSEEAMTALSVSDSERLAQGGVDDPLWYIHNLPEGQTDPNATLQLTSILPEEGGAIAQNRNSSIQGYASDSPFEGLKLWLTDASQQIPVWMYIVLALFFGGIGLFAITGAFVMLKMLFNKNTPSDVPYVYLHPSSVPNGVHQPEAFNGVIPHNPSAQRPLQNDIKIKDTSHINPDAYLKASSERQTGYNNTSKNYATSPQTQEESRFGKLVRFPTKRRKELFRKTAVIPNTQPATR